MVGFVFRLVGRMVGFAFKATIFVVAIVAVGAGTMYALFDAEQYKRVATQRLVDLTGRAVSIGGPAELELTLPPRVILHDVRIGNARWGTRPDMARIARVEMRLNPLRAIAGDSGTADVRLAGVDLYLETGPAGVGNWEFGPILSGAAMAGVGGAMVVLDALGVLMPVAPGASVSVSGVNVTFRDGGSGRTQTASLGNTAVEVATNKATTAGNLSVAAITDKRDDPCEKDGTLVIR